MPRGEPGDKTVTICICKRRDVWFCSLQPSRYRKMAEFSSLLLQRRPSRITRAKAIHSTWWDKMTRVQSWIRPILGLCCHRRNIISSHPLLPWSVKCWGRAVCQRSTLLLLITAMKRNCNCLPIFKRTRPMWGAQNTFKTKICRLPAHKTQLKSPNYSWPMWIILKHFFKNHHSRIS